MNRIQPIDAMYGGVMNGIMKMMSSQPCFASCVRASRYAVGTAISVEHSTTQMPRRSEFHTVSTSSALIIVAHA